MVNVLESKSTHPVATAIHEYVGNIDAGVPTGKCYEGNFQVMDFELKLMAKLLVGNFKLLDKYSVVLYDIDPTSIVYTVIAVSYDHKFAGYI